ncbi:hypothetical protein [Halospeciosus flavus]|uniref:Gins51 C-terminal domain-containing protein n=1 Tax=Halospeciosus flavus TaxID=3032283 RepID=A0ABD5Z1H8_9EURY|nr:hypothetical protein [Halospeciosus flavus]
MDLEELRAAQTRERASDGLQDLRDSFYEEVAEYIESLRERRDAAAEEAADPFRDEEVQSLSDEIDTAEQIAEALYERRMGKVVKQASLAAAGMESGMEGLTAEEKRLYGDLVERIEENKSHVLDVIAGDVEPGGSLETGKIGTEPKAELAESPRDGTTADSTGSDAAAGTETKTETETGADTVEPSAPELPDPVGAEPGSSPEPASESEAESPSSAAAAMGSEDLAADEAGDEPAAIDDEPATARTTLRITQDVGEVFGVDERAYDLQQDDVVTLPKENADPLLERDAAERLGE